MVESGFKYHVHSFKAMGSFISLNVELHDGFDSSEIFKNVEKIFNNVEKVASRFIVGNDLDMLNNSLNTWVSVDEVLFDLIRESFYAYEKTSGLFDPRILNNLKQSGYAISFNENSWTSNSDNPEPISTVWKPEFNEETHSVNIGSLPIDLGGIGKSYTVWLAYLELVKFSSNFFVNGGGDVLFAGKQSDGNLWTVGVENPFLSDSKDYIAVVAVSNVGVATSSLSKRSWVDSDGNTHHHIINPSTGLPARNGIMSVTVVHEDVVYAEIWSKSLFLKNQDELNEITHELFLPALWVTEDGKMHHNYLMSKYLI